MILSRSHCVCTILGGAEVVSIVLANRQRRGEASHPRLDYPVSVANRLVGSPATHCG